MYMLKLLLFCILCGNFVMINNCIEISIIMVTLSMPTYPPTYPPYLLTYVPYIDLPTYSLQ